MLNQFLSGKKTFSLFLLIIRLLYCSDTKQNARNFTIARTLQYFLQKFSKIEIRVYSFAKISLHRFVILTAIPRRASIVRARNTRAHTHNESVFFHFRSMERNRSISNSCWPDDSIRQQQIDVVSRIQSGGSMIFEDWCFVNPAVGWIDHCTSQTKKVSKLHGLSFHFNPLPSLFHSSRQCSSSPFSYL